MKVFFSLLAINIRQAVFSLRFLVSACGVTLTMFLTGLGLLSTAHDVIYLCGLSSGSESRMLMVGILPLFPFAITFAIEWEQRATQFWMIRTGIRNYSSSKVFVSALSGFLTTALGVSIFVLMALIRFPLFTHVSTGDAYSVLLEAGKPVQYLCYYIVHISLSSALFAVAAVWISAYIPNRYAAVAGPLVLYFVAHRFTTTLDIPQYLKVITIVEGGYDAGTPQKTLLLKLGIVMALCLLMGYGTIRQIRRRVFRD